MSKGFQQQNPWATFSPPRTDPLPQHGRKADSSCAKPDTQRRAPPRPCH
jgi:hypothetical protein